MTDRLADMRRRLEHAAHRHWTYEVEQHEEGGCPFYRIHVPTRGRKLYTIMIASGIHGDEPAGVEAVLRMLEDQAVPANVALEVFPCMNPEGYQAGTRENGAGRDLNREFCVAEPAWPIDRFMAMAGSRRWDLYLDLHEDVDTEGFYMYELEEDEPCLARAIVEGVERAGFPLEPAPHLDEVLTRDGLKFSDRPAEPGLSIQRRRDLPKEATAQAIYMATRADRVLTFETPGRAPFERRVAMHQVALRALFLELQRSRSALLPNEFRAAEGRRR